jgi:hypothetical protein
MTAQELMTAQEILALEQRRFKAMIAGDAGALEALLHRDLKYTHSSSTVDSKDSYVRGVRETLWDYRSIRTSNEAVSPSSTAVCRSTSRSRMFRGRSTRLR